MRTAVLLLTAFFIQALFLPVCGFSQNHYIRTSHVSELQEFLRHTPDRIPLEAITATTTIWHGALDTTWPPSFAEFLNKAIANSILYKIEDQGHLLYLAEWNTILTRTILPQGG